MQFGELYLCEISTGRDSEYLCHLLYSHVFTVQCNRRLFYTHYINFFVVYIRSIFTLFSSYGSLLSDEELNAICAWPPPFSSFILYSTQEIVCTGTLVFFRTFSTTQCLGTLH